MNLFMYLNIYLYLNFLSILSIWNKLYLLPGWCQMQHSFKGSNMYLYTNALTIQSTQCYWEPWSWTYSYEPSSWNIHKQSSFFQMQRIISCSAWNAEIICELWKHLLWMVHFSSLLSKKQNTVLHYINIAKGPTRKVLQPNQLSSTGNNFDSCYKLSTALTAATNCRQLWQLL